MKVVRQAALFDSMRDREKGGGVLIFVVIISLVDKNRKSKSTKKFPS